MSGLLSAPKMHTLSSSKKVGLPIDVCKSMEDRIERCCVGDTDLTFFSMYKAQHPTGKEDDRFAKIERRLRIALAFSFKDDAALNEYKRDYPDDYKEVYKHYGFAEFARTRDYIYLSKKQLMIYDSHWKETGIESYAKCECCAKSVLGSTHPIFTCLGCYRNYHQPCLSKFLSRGGYCPSCE